MSRVKRIGLVIAAIPVLGLALFFVTARYGVEPYHGIRYISRSPVATITWGSADSYIIQQGVNLVADQGMGRPGNVIEFPVSSHTRVSMRLFSFRWLAEEFRGWRSNHEWARADCRITSYRTPPRHHPVLLGSAGLDSGDAAGPAPSGDRCVGR